jgi:hypothetical protein
MIKTCDAPWLTAMDTPRLQAAAYPRLEESRSINVPGQLAHTASVGSTAEALSTRIRISGFCERADLRARMLADESFQFTTTTAVNALSLVQQDPEDVDFEELELCKDLLMRFERRCLWPDDVNYGVDHLRDREPKAAHAASGGVDEGLCPHGDRVIDRTLDIVEKGRWPRVRTPADG